MSLALLCILLCAIAVYWVMTQILPERRRVSLLRPGLADGLLEHINERRHADGLPILEPDDDLMMVAENKATHQLLTGQSDEGWDYPPQYAAMFGRSLLMEALIIGPATAMSERLARQSELFDGEWISCGLGVAGGTSGQIVVAIVVCREAWEAMPEASHRSLAERLVLGD